MVQLLPMFVLFLALNFAEGTVTLGAVPETIEVGLTTTFNITCTVPPHTAASVTAVRIFHRTNGNLHFTELANIDRFGHIFSHDPHVANLSGHVIDQGYTYLTLLWVYPTSIQAGTYECNVSMLVLSPHIHTLHEMADITVNQRKPDFEQVIKELRTVRNYIDRQLKTEAASWRDRLDQFTTSHFEHLIPVGRKKILVSNVMDVTAMQAEIMCHLLGGYLAELNQSDVIDIQTQLNSNSTQEVEIVLIGGNDPELAGHWVYLRNKQPFQLPSSLTLSQGGDCLALNATQNYEYVTVPCSNPNNGDPSKFLCELTS